jgi:hypothetical protein
LLGFLGVIIAIILLSTSSYWQDLINPEIYPMTIGFLVIISVIAAIFLLIIGLLALLGGISALQRKRWGLALAGSIVGIFCNSAILGILSLIFLAMSKDEFTS